jgi:TolB-like protein
MEIRTSFNTLALLLLLLAQLTSASAADATPPPLTVAVYDFTDTGAGGFGGKVTTLVTADLTTETNIVMLERAQLSKALNEQAFGISGLVSSDAAAKIGQLTGAKVLVAGQVMKTQPTHLVIIANIIGTETGRLYAARVDGSTDQLLDLTTDLAKKIADTIRAQTTNLVTGAQETHEQWLTRLVQSIPGTNRPVVSVRINLPARGTTATATGEFGILLEKAGFTVVDANSDQKPDIEITGVCDLSPGPRQNGLFSFRAVIELKVQERRTGQIITFDRQESTATDAARAGANRSAQVNAVDALAERVLPLLAK